jgi:predicted nucleic acid-binding protein
MPEVILLDTHVWLWFINGDFRKFPASWQERIETAERVGVSSVSCHEMALAAERRKLSLPDEPEQDRTRTRPLDADKIRRYFVDERTRHGDILPAVARTPQPSGAPCGVAAFERIGRPRRPLVPFAAGDAGNFRRASTDSPEASGVSGWRDCRPPARRIHRPSGSRSARQKKGLARKGQPLFFVWCRGRESNPHGLAPGGF